MTEAFLSLYNTRIRFIEAAMENGTATPGMEAELAELKEKVEQLEQYQDRLPEIEEALRQSSTATP
ncbi:MAG: hypothetical protein R3B96_16600 [Pirellulaceae bacterium]